MNKKWVYHFNELDRAESDMGNDWDNVRGLLGGKGANLAEMDRIGVPVPPGFTVTTEACNAYLAAKSVFSEEIWDQEIEALRLIEKETGKTFGSTENPLLVSCRSGAKFSMPGMMDTVLNIGLNDETAAAMVKLTGDERFVFDAYRRLIQMFGTVVMGLEDDIFEEIITLSRDNAGVESDADLSATDWKEITRQFKTVFRRHASRDFPLDPYEQMMLATEAVFKSWNGKRAVDYRNAAGIPHDLGTAVNIVTMVFGNMGDDSATGVAMTRNGSTGEKLIEGDFLTNAQGEDVVADIKDPWLDKLLLWADEYRRLGVWANADYPVDAIRARDYGAEGIGLCRSEHMFFEPERLPFIQKMIMTDLPFERQEALDALLPFQREDFAGLFRAMDSLPVIIRLLDPPLHEFLPNNIDLMRELSDLKIRLQHAGTLQEIDALLDQVKKKERILKRVESIREENPMLGLRGVRLGIHIPELTTMQVRAIFEAACLVSKEGVNVHPEIMIPLTSHVNELKVQRAVLEDEALRVMSEKKMQIDYKFGTMIEIPRAAFTADQIAEYASFFSFGTNDLTQTTFGISRDDAESSFMIEYMENGILPDNPFATIDKDGVGELMKIAVTKGRKVNPNLECGICGEHGGEPRSIKLCHELGLNYVSCSPFRVPIARLAAAHAALAEDT